MKKSSVQVSESMPLAILLTLSGGFMDAYSYLMRDQVFANAQTGNLLLLGVNLFRGNYASILRYLLPVVAFALGIASAELTRHLFRDKKILHWRQVILLGEAVILFGVSSMPQDMNLLANSLTSFACGAQVESFRKLNGHDIATTMCIGNLRAATQALCDYGLTKSPAAREKGVVYFFVIAVFVVGAILGSMTIERWAERAILVSVALLIAGCALMFIKKEE